MNERFEKTEIQKTLLESLLSSPDDFSICESLILPEYFNPELVNAVKFIKDYYSKYNDIPTYKIIKAETGIKFNYIDINDSVQKWTLDNIEEFCKHKAVFVAIQNSLDDFEKGKYGSIAERVQKANEVSITKDLGFEYFSNVDDRIDRMLQEPPTITTGWQSVDDILEGGIARKELILFAGASGVGKSFTLANLGMNFLKRGKNVLFLSLELSEDRIAQRIDQMLTGIKGAAWRFKTNEIKKSIIKEKENHGELTIKMLPSGTTPNQMRAYLKQFHLQRGYYPDLFIVDYLDEMAPNEYVSADNISEKDRRCTSGLRQIGVDFNMATATASQLNREAVESPIINHSHIAGGMGKIRISDVTIALRMDESQKHRGIMEFIFLKTRNSDGVYKQIHMHWNKEFVTIEDPKELKEEKQSSLKFNRRKDNINDDIGVSNNNVTNDIFDTLDRSMPNL